MWFLGNKWLNKQEPSYVIFSLTKEGELDLEAAEQALTEKAKIVSINHASNVLGTVTDVKRIAEMVHAVGGILVVDGAQAAPHQKVDVKR